MSEEESKLKMLTAIFERLGAHNPESWASSEINEGINQLAIFVFLKQAWENIIDETKFNEWFDLVEEQGKQYPHYFYGELSRALNEVFDAGVSRQQLVPLIQLIQHDMLDSLSGQLDNGGYSSPINVAEDEDWQRVYWRLHQVDEEGNILGSMNCLHEYADGEPPNGRESGFRSR